MRPFLSVVVFVCGCSYVWLCLSVAVHLCVFPLCFPITEVEDIYGEVTGILGAEEVRCNRVGVLCVVLCIRLTELE